MTLKEVWKTKTLTAWPDWLFFIGFAFMLFGFLEEQGLATWDTFRGIGYLSFFFFYGKRLLASFPTVEDL